MLLLQVFTPKIAHSSYVLAGSGTCAVIDPRRDVQVYIDAANSLGTKITHVLETHLHADFVSGHLDLAEKTGATIYAPRMGGCSFDHVPVADGDEIAVEDMVLRVIETPGHTPEHVCYVVSDTSRSQEPVSVFCGDTLFVGDVGRPDLFPGRAHELAHRLFSSLHDRLLKLPDHCEVYPAHGAGSLCGRSMAAKRTSTIGYERSCNPALQLRDVEAFTASLTTDMPPAPDHFGRCSAINGKGPALVRTLPAPRGISPAQFRSLADGRSAMVLDTRPYAAFGGLHIDGALGIDLSGNFPTFAGWVLPPTTDILLVTSEAAQVSEAVDWLRRVGLDRVRGFLEGGMPAWVSAGFPVRQVSQIGADGLADLLRRRERMELLDVRAAAEFEAGHIASARNIPVADLRTRHTELDRDAHIVVVCSTGNRASLGASLLALKGFGRVTVVAGGITGYLAAGFPLDL